MFRLVFIIFAMGMLLGCASNSMVYVESTNKNSRIDYVVIHATAENFAESLRLLTTRTSNPVSSHYLLPYLRDESYPHQNLRVYYLVDEGLRAWHAGVSHWAGEDSLNDRSIGIEVVNEFGCTGTDRPVPEIELSEVSCEFPPYSDEQILKLIELLQGILERYPGINPIDIVAHSDIAIMRKSDPGPEFPWEQLYEAGIGAWPDDDTVEQYQQAFAQDLPNIEQFQEALLALGYLVEPTGDFDKQTQFATRAFQLHFRPADYSGLLDVETSAILWSLLEKYRPRTLADL